MEENKKEKFKNLGKQEKGITLIALVVTIIVLLILAAVSINLVLGENGIIRRAREGKNNYAVAANEEQVTLSGTASQIDELTARTAPQGNPPPAEEETISKATTGAGFVGYYADLDGDYNQTTGTGIDGIIYVDLLVLKPDNGSWGPDWADLSNPENEAYFGTYILPTDVNATNVKDYVMSKEAVTDSRFDSTARYVISPASTTKGTKDRFYVMGLEDITDGTNSTLYWYDSAYDSSGSNRGEMTDYASTTSRDFGEGKNNTAAMLTKWKTEGYGEQNNRDIWKWIDVEEGGENEGWFVPSVGEWTAFANAFEISSSNYQSFKLNGCYWSSSQCSDTSACAAFFEECCIAGNTSGGENYLRLSTTF